jgi:hypothetical protein
MNIWKKAKVGDSEVKLSNLFTAFNKYHANARIPYNNIVAIGPNASDLHHIPLNFCNA